MLIGPPGSGKGTQARRIADRLAIPHISTGDILRAAVREQSPLGRLVADVMAGGGLVSDGLITELVEARLSQPDASSGFVLDGFPRTPSQIEALDRARTPSSLVIILIAAPDAAIVRRLSSRRVCDACSITQSVSELSEDEREACPYCGGTLVRRVDDHPDTVRRRLAAYALQSAPVVECYRVRPCFASVDGLRHADRVTAALLACITRLARVT